MLARPAGAMTGPLLETFTVNEIARQLSASGSRIAMFHYRDYQKWEIDLVIERRDGAVVAIEIKATRSPTPANSATSDGSGTSSTPSPPERSGPESCSTPDRSPSRWETGYTFAPPACSDRLRADPTGGCPDTAP